MKNEEVTISVGGGSTGGGGVTVTAAKTLAGWEDVEVTLRAEGFPPTFRLAASSGMPGGRDAAMAHAGDACFVRFGNDLVVTGYLTTLAAEIDDGSHRVELIGAGKTQDLIGEIEWDESRPYLNPTIDAIETIAGYFGLGVTIGAGAGAPPPGAPANLSDYPIMLDFGTSAADYVNQIARLLGLLAYEDSRGTLMLAPAGAQKAASGAVYGQNVQAASLLDSLEGRYSEVVATWYRQNQFLDGEANGGIFFARAADPGVPRKRVKHVFVENGPEGEAFTRRLAKWEAARRAARGRQVRVTVDSWRDKAGKLWAPNTIVPLDLPGLASDAGPYGLSEVTFRRNGSSGTTADMVLLPITGFTPEPVQPSGANLIGIADAPTS